VGQFGFYVDDTQGVNPRLATREQLRHLDAVPVARVVLLRRAPNATNGTAIPPKDFGIKRNASLTGLNLDYDAVRSRYRSSALRRSAAELPGDLDMSTNPGGLPYYMYTNAFGRSLVFSRRGSTISTSMAVAARTRRAT